MIGLASGVVAGVRLAPDRRWAVALVPGLALWLTSLASYVWFVAGAPGRAWLLALEAGVVAGAWALPRTPRPAGPGRARPADGAGRERWLAVALAAAVATALLGAALTLRRFPDGLWDAVDIWNARARMLVRTDLGAALARGHLPDYPLGLPLAVAHGWTWLGEGRAVPAAVAVAIGAGIAGVLHAAARRLAGPRAAAALAVLCLASPWFAVFTASQRADAPLALWMLTALAAAAWSLRADEPRALVLAGVATGAALWTKNEGQLFALVLAAAWLACAPPGRRADLWRPVLAAAPFALALAHHKLTCGAAPVLFAMQEEGGVWTKLVRPERWLAVAGAFARDGALYAVALVAAWRLLGARAGGSPEARLAAAVAAGMAAGYFGVYLVTPLPLDWHLASSLDRLLYQIWPLALLAVAASIAPGDAAAQGARPAPARRASSG